MTTPFFELGELVTIRKGQKALEVSEEPFEGFLRYIQIEDLRNDDSIKYARNPKGTVCEQTDLLIAWDGAKAGTVGFGIEGYVGSTIAILRPNELVFTPYLGMVLQSRYQMIRDACTGATIPHVSKPFLLSLKIPLPNFEEQKKIAEILNKADGIMKKSARARVLRREMSQSLFFEMFGNPLVNVDWDQQPFKNCVSDNTGGHAKIPQKHYQMDGKLPIIDQGRKLIAGWTDNLELECITTKPTILFGDHTKSLQLVDFPFALGADGVKVLSPNTDLFNPVFLFQLLMNLPLPDVGYSRHFKYLKEFDLICPPRDLQDAFSSILEKTSSFPSMMKPAMELRFSLRQELIN